MAALRPDDDWYERMYQRVHGVPTVAARTDRILRDVALMGGESPLFKHLRESFAESDPSFRARMERMAQEEK